MELYLKFKLGLEVGPSDASISNFPHLGAWMNDIFLFPLSEKAWAIENG